MMVLRMIRATFSLFRQRRALARLSLAASLGVTCLVMLFAPGTARATEEMSFRVVSVGDPARCGAKCPQVIAAEGEITERTPDRFLAFVHDNLDSGNLHAIVFFHSPGGRVVASMELGRALRRLGAATVVARALPGGGVMRFTGARCFSACVYALMGGKRRVIPPESEVGIHRMFTYDHGGDPAGPNGELHRHLDDGGMASELRRYSGMMGISPGLINEAEHISPDSLHIVTRAEIARWHLGSPRL